MLAPFHFYRPTKMRNPAPSARSGKISPKLRTLGTNVVRPDRMSQTASSSIPMLLVIPSDDLLRDT